MDSSNWNRNQGANSAVVDQSMESVDWRVHLQADSRLRIVNKIMDTLKKHLHLPLPGNEGLQELNKIAVRFEEKIYIEATSQSDYLRKISSKMLTIANRTQNLMSDNLQSSSGPNSVNPSDPGSQVMQQMSVPSNNNNNNIQSGQQMMTQSMHSNIVSTGMQNSSGLSSALPPGSGSIMPNVGNVGPGNFANQRQQIQIRQQQQQQQQTPNAHYLYQQQQQLQQMSNQKHQQQPVMQSHIHQQQQQQNLLQQSQQSVMQPPMMQNQPPVVSQPLMNHQQSVVRQRQQQLQPTQQNSMLQQSNVTNMQQNQLIGQRNNYSDMQQQQRLISQQNNLSNVQQQSQQQFIGQHNNNNLSNMQQQQQQSGNSNMQTNQQQMIHSNMPTQVQHVGMQQPNMMMQQRLPTSGVFQQQNVIDQQKQPFQQHRAMPEASSTSLDSTAQTISSNGGDWQEEVYQKIKAMKDLYLSDLNDMNQKILGKLQQFDSHPQQPKNEQVEKLRMFKSMLERFIQFLQIPKHGVMPNFKDKLGAYEKQIIQLINSNRRKVVGPQHTQSMQQPQHSQSHETQMNVQPNMMNSIQPSSNLDPGQNTNMNSLQHVSTGSFQQNTVSGPQQVNIQPNSNMQMKQFQQRQMHKQQQFNQQTKQLSQPQQINESNDMKARQMMNVKSVATQRSAYNQQLKPFSPQMSQHTSSPQIDQSNMVKSANSPSTSSASPIPVELISLPTQSLAIGTPGISASPLLAEFTSPDGNNGSVVLTGSGKSVTEQPLERLLKVVKSMSPKALRASVSDIDSVVSMIDMISGSAPGNGSRAAVGEDLVSMTKSRLQSRNFVTNDGTNGTRKMKRFTTAMPLSVVSSTGSVDDSFKHLNALESSELDSTASSSIKKPRTESNHALLEEIKAINRGLIDTVVSVNEHDADVAVSEGGDGTLITCSFSAVALGPNLKAHYASSEMSPIQPLRLLVPSNYPNSSPIFLDKFPTEFSKESDDISTKTKSRFSSCLRSLSQPFSLKEIARTWDACASAVITEYTQQSGGGTFSSKYGTWENCLSAA